MTEKMRTPEKNFKLFLVRMQLKTRLLVYICLLLFLGLAILGVYRNYQETLVE